MNLCRLEAKWETSLYVKVHQIFCHVDGLKFNVVDPLFVDS
jgi:hypothetical protein